MKLDKKNFQDKMSGNCKTTCYCLSGNVNLSLSQLYKNSQRDGSFNTNGLRDSGEEFSATRLVTANFVSIPVSQQTENNWQHPKRSPQAKCLRSKA